MKILSVRGRGGSNGEEMEQEKDRKMEAPAVPGVMVWAEGGGALAEFSTTFS